MHFLPFPYTVMVQIVQIIPPGTEGPIYPETTLYPIVKSDIDIQLSDFRKRLSLSVNWVIPAVHC